MEVGKVSGCAKPQKGSFWPQNKFFHFSTHISMVAHISLPRIYSHWYIWLTLSAYFGTDHLYECVVGHIPPNGPFSHVLGCITPFTSFQCGEHIPSAPKFSPGIHPMHIKLRLCYLSRTLYMIWWVRIPESGVVQVASTTGHDLVFSHTKNTL